MNLPDADSFLMGGGTPSAKFPTIGTSITGTVTREPEVLQQTDFDSGKPLFWDDGKPKLQARVVLATTERDSQIPDDDGTRAVYVKGQLQKAVAQAVRAAGAARLEVGGRLTVTYTADGERKGKLNPPKIFTAKFERPDPVAQAADPAPGAGQAGGQQDAPPPGIDPAAWANLSAAQQETLRAAMAAQATPPY